MIEPLIGGIFALTMYYLMLYVLASSKKNRQVAFYVLAGIPLLVGCFIYLLDGLMSSSLVFGTISVLLSVIYFFGWTTTLYRVGGEKKVFWFFMMAFISPLWIVYRLGEWK